MRLVRLREDTVKMRGSKKSHRERGATIVWAAILLPLLLGISGFAVDLGSWYLHIQRAQRAADAAALAGDPYLPGDEAAAISVAKEALKRNNVPQSEIDRAYIAPVAGKPTQLEVRVGTNVTNTFIRMLGLGETNRFVRSAIADHSPGLHINNGQNGLGGPEPDDGTGRWLPPASAGLNQYWLAIAGEGTNKNEGDRFSSVPCWINRPREGGSAGNHNPTACASDRNSEYGDEEYNYNISLEPTAALGSSAWVVVQAYDAAFNGNPGCVNDNANPMCPADEVYDRFTSNPYTQPGVNEPWTYFEAYESPTSNTVVPGSSCRGRSNGVPPTNGVLTIPSWSTVCSVPVNPAQKQTFSIRVSANNGVGTNHFMLRASYSSSASAASVNASHIALSHTNLNMSADKSFSIFQETARTGRFKIAQVGSEWAGKTIHLELFDVGDVYDAAGNGTYAGTISLAGDVDGPANYLQNCEYSPPPSRPLIRANLGPNGCGFAADQPNFKAQVIKFNWNVPANYRCDINGYSNCWLYIQMDLTGGWVIDDTTWTLREPGMPLRLIK